VRRFLTTVKSLQHPPPPTVNFSAAIDLLKLSASWVGLPYELFGKEPVFQDFLSSHSTVYLNFLQVHSRPTRNGELNSRHPQSPMRMEGIHTMGCPVPRRDSTTTTSVPRRPQHTSHRGFGGPEPCLPTLYDFTPLRDDDA
jgi:hypothetical protein